MSQEFQAGQPTPAQTNPETEPDLERAAARDLGRLQLQPWQRWLVFAIALIFFFEARTIVGPFIIAGILAYIFYGVVTNLAARLHWPRILVAALLYVVTLVVIGGLIYLGANALVRQTVELSRQGPGLVESGLVQLLGTGPFDLFGQHLDAHTLAQRINDAFGEFSSQPSGALHYGELIIGRLLDTLLVVVISFYLIVDGHKLGAYLLKFVPAESRPSVGYLTGRIHTVLGAYLRGQLILIALMSFVTFLILQFIFHLHYALPLALLTGVLEILPYIGPVIAAALSSGVGLAQYGPGTAIALLIVYLILRQLEDQLVMPFVVGRAVDLHPVATIFSVLAGGAVAGLLGILLAVPTAAAIKVILDYLYPSTPELAISQARPGLRRAARESTEQDDGS